MNKILFLFVTICLQGTLYAQKNLYVGTFKERGSEGIYVLNWNPKDASTTVLQTVEPLESPSFLAIHPNSENLYSANRESVVEGQKWGSISSFKIYKDGTLLPLNDAPSYGAGACHINVDATGRMAFAANYSGSNFIMMPLDPSGKFTGVHQQFDFTGTGPNERRQEKPHPHAVVISPDNKFAYVTDLGTDKIYAYCLKPKRKKIKPAKVPFTSTRPGGGPRHFTFHPNGKLAFMAAELSSEVSMFRYYPKNGQLEFLQRLSTLPKSFSDYNSVADIHVHPNGRWLYVSNRGHESLAIFEIDEATQKLTPKGHQNVHGKHPRNFVIDPFGKYLLVANRDTDNITIFTINSDTGQLSFTEKEIKIPAPVCLKFR